MRISFSPKSEPTVLYWHDRWWLPSHRIPVPFGDPGQAADMLAAAWRGKKPVLRIVWAPASFASVAVACPAADRATVAAALADEHPALSHPGHVWGCEPVQDGRTLLHYETEPGLFAVVRRLEDVGFGVESVWPMATWLAALAPEAAGLGRVAVVATDAGCWHLYRQSAAGRESFTGSELTRLAETLHHAPTEAAPSLLLHVTTTDEVMPLEPPGVSGRVAIWDALEKPVVLPARHPAQLLPPLPKLSLMRIVLAANLVCLLVALVAGCSLWTSRKKSEASKQAARAELQILSAEVVRLRANRDEILRLEAENGKPIPVGQFLAHAAAGMRAGIIVADLKVDQDGCHLTGWADPNRSDPWRSWHALWQRQGSDWKRPMRSSLEAQGGWVIDGVFR